MENKYDTDEKLMHQARFRVIAKMVFRIHVIVYIVINLGLVVIWLLTTKGGYFWPVWSVAGWGLGLLIHGLLTYIKLSRKTFNDDVQNEYQRLKNEK